MSRVGVSPGPVLGGTSGTAVSTQGGAAGTFNAMNAIASAAFVAPASGRIKVTISYDALVGVALTAVMWTALGFRLTSAGNPTVAAAKANSLVVPGTAAVYALTGVAVIEVAGLVAGATYSLDPFIATSSNPQNGGDPPFGTTPHLLAYTIEG